MGPFSTTNLKSFGLILDDRWTTNGTHQEEARVQPASFTALVMAEPTRHMGSTAKYEQPFSWSDYLFMLTPKRFTDRCRLTPDSFNTLDEAHAKSSRGESSAW